MVRRGGQPGNRNAARAKVWRDALRKALAQFEDDTVKRGEALQKIAESIVKDALAGNKDAWQEIGNRLDGRPAQAIIGGDDGDEPVKYDCRVRFIHAPQRDAE